MKSACNFLLIIFIGGLMGFQAEATVSISEIAEGKKIYEYRCYYCHGYSGNADTLASRLLEPKPRDFTESKAMGLTLAGIQSAVYSGRKNTAMPAFKNTLSDKEINLISHYIMEEFITGTKKQLGYHTKENGWQEHRMKYESAYGFVQGDLAIDVSDSHLNAREKEGRRIFLEGCITCHEPYSQHDEKIMFEPFSVSYPRSHSPFLEPDFFTSATIFRKHDEYKSDITEGLSKGKRLFEDNCAFCHGKDGSGKNWIGRFMQPNARDLSDISYIKQHTVESLSAIIATGVVNTSMPRWDGVLTNDQISLIAKYVIDSVQERHKAASEINGGG